MKKGGGEGEGEGGEVEGGEGEGGEGERGGSKKVGCIGRHRCKSFFVLYRVVF